MNGIIHFETFFLTGIILNLTPGNDTIFILSRSIAQGRRAGIVSALGIATGSLVHTLLAAFGLSVIIAESMLLFNIIKYAGAAYLVYIGIRMLFDRSGLAKVGGVARGSVNLAIVYRDAVITNVLNPKVALFFISFLPQFIDPSATHTIVPFLLLGATFITTGTVWCMSLALFASVFASRLRRSPSIAGYINKFCGLALVALGIRVALMDRK